MDTPFGPVFLIPYQPPSLQTFATLPASLRRGIAYHTARKRAATLGIVALGGGDCCATAAMLAATGGGISGGSSPTTRVLVLPDGVAKVTVQIPRQRIAGEPAYSHPLSITVAVHDNVAAFAVNRYADDVGTENMIWYGPTGEIIKRIGSPQNLTRVRRTTTNHPSPTKP